MDSVLNILFWVIGIVCVGSALFGAFFGPFFLMHEDSRSSWLYIIVAGGVLIILLAPHTSILSLIGLLLLTVIIFLFFLISSKFGSKIFKIGAQLGQESIPPIPRGKESALPPASIFDAIINPARRKYIDSPPEGYWSVIFPNPMLLGQEHVVKINMSPLAKNSTKHDAWFDAIKNSLEDNEEVNLLIEPVAQSFDVKPKSRELVMKSLYRQVSIDFFVTPTQMGKHPIRFEIYLGKTQLGWFQETIKVNINRQKLLIYFGEIIAIITAIFSILNTLKIIP